MTRTEQNAARTILGQSVGQVNVDGRTYDIPAPTTATLIMVSALAAELPEFATSIPKEDIVPTVLRTARHCNALGQIAAVLVLGAKRIRETPFATVEKIPQCATLVMAPTAQDRTRGYHQTDSGRARLSCRQNTGRNDIGSTTRTCGSNTRRSGDSRFFRAYHFPPHKRLLAPTREVETTASGHLSEVGLSTCN